MGEAARVSPFLFSGMKYAGRHQCASAVPTGLLHYIQRTQGCRPGLTNAAPAALKQCD
jgi:hypothetical protein